LTLGAGEAPKLSLASPGVEEEQEPLSRLSFWAWNLGLKTRKMVIHIYIYTHNDCDFNTV
jgi:hypothetical protein